MHTFQVTWDGRCYGKRDGQCRWDEASVGPGWTAEAAEAAAAEPARSPSSKPGVTKWWAA
jgi:hypothetical protein